VPELCGAGGPSLLQLCASRPSGPGCFSRSFPGVRAAVEPSGLPTSYLFGLSTHGLFATIRSNTGSHSVKLRSQSDSVPRPPSRSARSRQRPESLPVRLRRSRQLPGQTPHRPATMDRAWDIQCLKELPARPTGATAREIRCDMSARQSPPDRLNRSFSR